MPVRRPPNEHRAMRRARRCVISEDQLAAMVAGLPARLRVVAGGNFATRAASWPPWTPRPLYRLFMLNAQGDLPGRIVVPLRCRWTLRHYSGLD
ncbi:hypothetical protein ACH35V_22410 [Actinomadura sp. 1N219]|uniref:hypothetical protein n=1 Tax=Actinomadura sp. 1N219 TaxID=3375152 RepID=UPI00378FA491